MNNYGKTVHNKVIIKSLVERVFMMRKLSALLAVAILLVGCRSNKEVTSKEQTSNQETSQNTEHLDYSKQDEWKIASGEMQSPININMSEIVSMLDAGQLDLNYDHQISYVEDNEHSIQVGAGGVGMINGRRFELEQIHFHSMSEHTINEEAYPLEAHFVHQSQDGRIAVIGVLFKEGAENDSFQSILDYIKQDEKNEVTVDIDLESLIPESKNYFHYLGSLTTPPLTENVEWYIFSEFVELSKEQIEKFQEYYHDNHRNLQPLNGRSILFHEQS